MSKVFHVKLRDPVAGQTDFYFGSQAAIYDHLPEDVIGCKVTHLWRTLGPGSPYENKKCTIVQGELLRKKTGRGKNEKG